MSIKITIPNSSSDVLTFGSGNTPTAAQIAGIDSGSSNGQLALYTTASGTSTERVRVDSSGNVGIGLTSPAYKLEASSSTNNYIGVTCTTDGNAASRFKNNQRDWLVGVLGGASGAWVVYDITASAERMRIDSSGNLLVGTQSALIASSRRGISVAAPTGSFVAAVFKNDGGASAQTMDVWNAATSGNNIFISCYTEGSATDRGGLYYDRAANQTKLAATSDQRLKENIVDAPAALPVVAQIKVRQYDWKETGSTNIGFVAQELYQVVERAVAVGEDNEDGSIKRPWGVDNSTLVPYLTKAIQEQQAIITSLTDRITALEGAK